MSCLLEAHTAKSASWRLMRLPDHRPRMPPRRSRQRSACHPNNADTSRGTKGAEHLVIACHRRGSARLERRINWLGHAPDAAVILPCRH
jgi:hypothetical protein